MASESYINVSNQYSRPLEGVYLANWEDSHNCYYAPQTSAVQKGAHLVIVVLESEKYELKACAVDTQALQKIDFEIRQIQHVRNSSRELLGCCCQVTLILKPSLEMRERRSIKINKLITRGNGHLLA